MLLESRYTRFMEFKFLGQTTTNWNMSCLHAWKFVLIIKINKKNNNFAGCVWTDNEHKFT